MAFSRGIVRGQVLAILQKSPGYQGFYTDAKCNAAIQESLDMVAMKMFMNGDGWLTQKRYIDTVANQVTVNIPEDFIMIDRVWYLTNNFYRPLNYSDDPRTPETSPQSGQIQYPSTYKIVGNQIFFNPAVGIGGAKYLQIEGDVMPASIISDYEYIPLRFNRALMWYVTYRSCSVLGSQIGKVVKEWQAQENEWYSILEQSLVKRVTTASRINDFDG